MSADVATGPPPFRTADTLIKNPPLFLQSVFIVVAALALPFLTHAPNRLVSGQPIPLWALPDPASLIFLVAGVALLVGGFLQQTQRVARVLGLATILFLVGLVYVASLGANASAASASSDAARTSLGSGFWVMALAAALAFADLMARAGLSPRARIVAGLVAMAPVVAMIFFGQLDTLSIMVEYANKADIFHRAIGEHLVIVLTAMVPTLLIGIPLGVLVHRKARVKGPVLTVLNVIQTIPSIALFGLLIAPLSALVVVVPGLKALGISGIGLAPAVIALTLYSLLPIVRNTSEGLAGVPRGAFEAAQGMGMTPSQVFWQVEVPLALPVFLSGLRVTVVQAIDRKSTRLNSSHPSISRMPSSA